MSGLVVGTLVAASSVSTVLSAECRVYPSVEQVNLSFVNAVLLDAYGVFWGGNEVKVLPGAKEVMERLVASGKIVGILSNSTQPAANEMKKFEKNGLLCGKHYHFLITSGDVAKTVFKKEELPFPTSKKKYWPSSPAHPDPRFVPFQNMFEGTPYTEAKSLDEADFIYVTIPHVDGKNIENPEVFRETVQTLSKSKLPMVCVNPDLYSMEGNQSKLVVRQGRIAQMYEEAGGTVFYVGKPHLKVYEVAMKSFAERGISSPQEVLMVGDTPETDIRGGRQAGMQTALLTGTGVFSDRKCRSTLEAALQQLAPSDQPDYSVDRLGVVH